MHVWPAACAENLTPVLIEAGGKDSLIVDEDADLTNAAEAALWCGMSNAGQTCIGTEGVYVHEKVFDAFINEITSQAKDLHASPDGKIGPITMPSQLDIIKSHIDDAIAGGATVILGGADAVGERYVQPTILTHVPEDSTAITDETFGPTLAINPVESMDKAIQLTNATKYGLAGAVFAKKNGVDIARRVRSGMTSVNSVVAFAGVPALPCGGVGESGFGRIHGPDGLKEFTFAKSITRQRFKPIMQLTSFARHQDRRHGRAYDDGPAWRQEDTEIGQWVVGSAMEAIHQEPSRSAEPTPLSTGRTRHAESQWRMAQCPDSGHVD